MSHFGYNYRNICESVSIDKKGWVVLNRVFKKEKSVIGSMNYSAFKSANSDLQYLSDRDVEKYLNESGLGEIEAGERKFHIDYTPFSESLYLKLFPDVRQEVKEREIVSGFEHFCLFGYKEIIDGERIWTKVPQVSIADDTESQDIPVAFRANIDRYESNLLHGWAIDIDHPERKLTVEILIDDEKIGEVTADNNRNDLRKEFGGDGKYAFAFKVDQVAAKSKMGIATLREKETGTIIPMNRFSIKYDLEYLFADGIEDVLKINKNNMRKFSDSVDAYQTALDSYLSHDFSKAKNIIESLLRNDKYTPNVLTEALLKIYLSEQDTINTIALYQSTVDNAISDEMTEKIHSHILSYCSELWLSDPAEYLSAQIVHKLEILLMILGNLRTEDRYTFDSNKDIDSLLIVSLKSGLLLDKRSVEKLFILIVGNFPDDEAIEVKDTYIDNLLFMQLLLNSTHTVDINTLREINLHLETMVEYDGDNVMVQEIIKSYLMYIESLINTKRLHKVDADRLLRILRTKIVKHLKADLRLNVIIADLYYLLGNYQRSVGIFNDLFEENISYFDWNCTYLSEILLSIFKSSNYVIDDQLIVKLLHDRLKENRASYIDNIIILSDIYQWKESVDSNILYKVVGNLIVDSHSYIDSKIVDYVKSTINSLLHETVNAYLGNAYDLEKYFRESKHKDISLNFHTSELFERQTLYYLNILNSQKDFKNPMNLDKKYYGLLNKEKREYLESQRDSGQTTERIAFLTLADDSLEALYLSYYKSMLIFSKNRDSEIFICFSEYYYQLSLKDDNINILKEIYTEGHFIEDLSSSQYAMYVLLGSNSIVHHNSINAIDFDTNTCYLASDEEEPGFSVTSDLFQYFISLDQHCDGSNIPESLFMLRTRIPEYTHLSYASFANQEQGIISFGNIEMDKIKLLTNYDHPVFEMYDIKNSLEYLAALYSDERINALTSINIGDVSLNLVKPFTIKESEEDIACFLVQRNEYLRLEGFLDYYREIGVNKFYIIDNASNDGITVDFLLDQDDVELYSTTQAYSQSVFGIKWAELLIRTKRIGKWNLLVDADELLFMNENFHSIKKACAHLDNHGYDSLYTPFIDMYSNSSISEAKYLKGREILNSCAYHDKHFYTFFNVHGGIKGSLNTYQGGLRSRIFGLDTVVLNKLPLFKYDIKHTLREGLHWIDDAVPAYGQALLLHFKYIETFHQYVAREIKRGQHWDGASEYQQYHHLIDNNPDFSLYNSVLSSKFTTVGDFYEKQFTPFESREDGQ